MHRGAQRFGANPHPRSKNDEKIPPRKDFIRRRRCARSIK
jgi:hypothetical protein